MLRTKTTLGGTGSINADNRGTEPAFVGVVAAQAAQSDFERLVRHRSKKNGEGTKKPLAKRWGVRPERIAHGSKRRTHSPWCLP
jgi:hypothetical protein